MSNMDAEAVSLIDHACVRLRTESLLKAENVQDYLAYPDMNGAVWDDSGDTQGYVLWGYQVGQKHAVVFRLVVAHRARGHGVGSKLLDHVLTTLGRESKVKRLLLFVPEASLEAQLWLKHRGFRCKAISPDYYGDGEDGYLFQLPMTAGVTK